MKTKISLVLATVVCASYMSLPGIRLQASSSDYVWAGSGNIWTSPAMWGRVDEGDYPHLVGDSATLGRAGAGSTIFTNLGGLAHMLSILNIGSRSSDIVFSNNTAGRFVMQAPGEDFAQINSINMTGSAYVDLPRMVLNSTTIVTANQGRFNFIGRSTSHTSISGTADIYFRGSGGVSAIGGFGITASVPYSGNIIVDQQGTLLIQAVIENHTGTSVTVADTGTLGGTSTLGRATTIQSGGTLAPGASAGLMTFGSGLTLAAGSHFEFELFGNTVADRGVNYDGVNVTGGVLSVDSGALFDIVLNGSGSDVDFTDDFWGSNQSWLVFSNGAEPSLLSGIFTLGTISQDSLGQDFSVTGGSFDFGLDGDDIYLLYTIPEPATMATLAGIVTLLMVVMRRRRRA